jgi:II/X family phage/plasmid replication protein
MIDTVGLVSPGISDEAAELVRQLPDTMDRIGVRTATGEVEYSITKSDLVGSFDHRFSVRLAEDGAPGPASEGAGQARHLQIEGSIHKAILGHNVYGGPTELLPSVKWLVESLKARLGIDLPPAETWRLHRLDWAEVFDVDRFEVANEFFLNLSGGKYRRRQANIYTGQSIQWAGSVSAFKVYHKGPEFAKHDAPRLFKYVDRLDVAGLQGRANGLIRCEVEVRRKLKNDFGGWPTVDQVPADYVERLYDTEVSAFLGQSSSSMELVRTHKAVSRRLVEVYGSRLGNLLFGTWLQLAALGDAECRKALPHRTYYRHRKLLKDASVSWQGADVRIVERLSLVPGDFSVRRSDPRRLTGEAPQVIAALAPYRRAS